MDYIYPRLTNKVGDPAEPVVSEGVLNKGRAKERTGTQDAA